MLLRSPEECPELPGPAHQGERLLDQHRLARGCETLERRDRLIDLPGLRGRDGRRGNRAPAATFDGTNPDVRPGRSRLQSTRPTVIRWRRSTRRIAFTSVSTQARAISGRGRPFCVERDELDDSGLAAERRAEPVAGLASSARHDRLVHQVVAEHRRAPGTAGGDGLPEPDLGGPARRLIERVVPRGHVLSCGNSPGR